MKKGTINKLYISKQDEMNKIKPDKQKKQPELKK